MTQIQNADTESDSDKIPDADSESKTHSEKIHDDNKRSKKLSKQQIKIRKFLDILGLTFRDNHQFSDFDDLVQAYGIDLILEITRWVKTKDVSNLGRALAMIQRAAPE